MGSVRPPAKIFNANGLSTLSQNMTQTLGRQSRLRNCLRAASATSPWSLLVLLALKLVIAPSLYAATITANSVQRNDVAAAIAQASDGDTVIIPAGTATYTSTVTIDKAITLQGAGAGQTIILDNVSGDTTSVFIWNTEFGKFYRMSGIEIGRSRTAGEISGAVRLTGTSTSVRIDHCKFNGPANEHITVYGGVYGVIDNCEFILQGSVRAIMFFNGDVDGKAFGDGSWETEVDWGGPGAIYMEDCLVTNPSGVYPTFDGWQGGRIVFRYNTVLNSHLGNHGTESSQRKRGARSMEIYGNRLSSSVAAAHAITIRGGTAVIFDNIIEGPFSNAIVPTAYRSIASYPPWGGADGTMAWDSNDYSDGPATPGGSGDGVFEAGVSTNGGQRLLIDTSKNWIPDQWAGHVLRWTVTHEATSGGTRTATVPGANWETSGNNGRGQWHRWTLTNLRTNEKAPVDSNTADTITTNSSASAINIQPGDRFTLSRFAEISSNSSNEIRIRLDTTLMPDYIFAPNQQYEIRRLKGILDGPGRGQTVAISGTWPPRHQDLQQKNEPIYQWNNQLNEKPVQIFSKQGSIIDGQHYINGLPKPGYTPYTYPHPLRGSAGVGTKTPPAAPSNARVAGS